MRKSATNNEAENGVGTVDKTMNLVQSLSPSILKWHKMPKEFVAPGGNRLRKSAELPHCCLGELPAVREEVSGRESHFLLTQHSSAMIDKAGSCTESCHGH